MKGKIFTKILKSDAVRKAIKFTVENAPKILTGVSIASSVAATAFAVRGTILAVDIERTRRMRIATGQLPQPKHPKWETFKAVWKCYIPSALFQTVSIGTALYGVDISTARTAMATAACKATEYAFDEYKAKMAEEIGEEKEKKVRQDILKEHAEEQVTTPASTLIISPYEKVLFQEQITGQIFLSDVNTVKETFNRINYQLSHGYSDYISVMEYLDELGISSKDEERGWNVSVSGLLEPKFELDTTDDGRPCLKLSTIDPPYIDYNMYS